VSRLVLCALLSLVGCFDPQIPSGGFTCTADHPQCPEGFSCVSNLCVQGTQAPENNPDALLTLPDLAPPTDGASQRDAMSCVASGGDCTYHRDGVCCSGACVYSTNKCK